jgi:predicted glutamine amidotransferase
MCRLLLCNAATLRHLEEIFESAQDALSICFGELEQSNGGHGNGVAALWTGTQPVVRVRKGRRLKVEQAAEQLCTWAAQGAEWFLFHTRLASAALIASRHCHPFQAGDLVLAHNGHDRQWAALGQEAAEELTDSEAVTRTWDALQLPPSALVQVRGVFVGFHAGHPFGLDPRKWRR